MYYFIILALNDESDMACSTHGKKGKAISVQTWTGPGGSGRLRLLDFKIIDSSRW